MNTDGNLLRYCDSFEGIYYSDGSDSGEHYSVDYMGGFELLSDNEEILESGHIAFTSVVNPDGTTSLCRNFVSIEGETMLIFPVKDIANISKVLEESGYYRMN